MRRASLLPLVLTLALAGCFKPEIRQGNYIVGAVVFVILEAKHVIEPLPAPEDVDENGVPAPAARGPLGYARMLANRAFTETVAIPDGHGAVEGNGHGEIEGGEHAAIGSHEEQ